MIRSFARILPVKVRRNLRAALCLSLGGTVIQGYEQYARSFQPKSGKHLGDEWNEPDVIGMDVSPDMVVATLDEKIFSPFLGRCGTILEIGAGGGRFTEILIPKCDRLIAADTSPTMISLLKERFGNISSVETLFLDGCGLCSIRDHSIDAAFSYDVFNHLQAWDIFNYLCELRRVIKPGGKIILHHSNTFSELGWKRFLSEVPLQLRMPKDWGSLSVMTPELFRQFSEKAGLVVVECITDVVRRDCITLLKSP